MKGPVVAEARSLRALRWRARAPRLLATGCIALLALAGLRAAISPAEPSSLHVPGNTEEPYAEAAIAEAFARAYLGWDAAHPELREQRLSAVMSSALEPDGGLAAAGTRRDVAWTAVVAARRSGPRTTVVVAAEVGGEVLHLAIPVERDARGFLAVGGYPALIGAPATRSDLTAKPEDEVGDPELRAVCERVVRNYLAGERRNLAADLADGAVVTLPARRLTVQSIESVGWVRPGRRVAVHARAEDEVGAEWTLRYELAVVRRERWYVRELHVDPRSKGAP